MNELMNFQESFEKFSKTIHNFILLFRIEDKTFESRTIYALIS
jgi:hypothetical protein